MNRLKKAVAGLISLTTIIASLLFIGSANAASTSMTYLTGDIDGDGSISVSDTLAITKYLNGIYSFTAAQFTRADANLDNVVDYADLNLIAKYMVLSATPKTVTRDRLSITSSSSRTYSEFKYDDDSSSLVGNYTLSLTSYSSSASATSSTDSSKVTIPQLRADNSHQNVVEIITDDGTYSGFIVGDHQIATTAEAVYDNSSYKINAKNVRKNISMSIYSDYKTAEVTELSPDYIHVPNSYMVSSSTDFIYNYAVIEVADDLSEYGIWNLGVISDEFTENNPVVELNGFENHKRYLSYGIVEDLESELGNSDKYLKKHHIQSECGNMGDPETGTMLGGVTIYDGTNSAIGIPAYFNTESNGRTDSMRVTSALLRFYISNTNLEF
jgi:hypothetical protein